MKFKSDSHVPARCRLLLQQWREELAMTNFEKDELTGAIKTLDRQLERLSNKHLRVAVFGKVGAGKSSVLNALSNSKSFATDVRHGCTRQTKAIEWRQPFQSLTKVELVDTPGIDEINAKHQSRLAARLALKVDLVLFVLDSDINSIEIKALQILIHKGKPIVLVLNRCDQWSVDEQKNLIHSIRNRLPFEAKHLKLYPISAAPREIQLTDSQKVRSFECEPKIENFKIELIQFIETQGEMLLVLNSLRQSDSFYQSLKASRLKRSKAAAQSLIGRYAALKASGVAANPMVILDCAGSLACDTALVIQLSKLYGLRLKKQSARDLLKSLSIYSSFIGGAQIGIQVAIGIIRQLLILATPLTHGLSLASAAPVAVIQAALAVQTTKLTGRLAAKELLKGSIRQRSKPKAILRNLINDPQIKHLLQTWPELKNHNSKNFQALLP